MSELVTWAQVCSRTGSAEAARHAIRSGTYVRVRRGTYLPAEDAPADQGAHHRLLIAATLPHLGSSPTLAVQSAALVLGIPLVVPVPDRVQIAERRRSGGRSTGRVARHSTVGDLPTTTSGGLTTTTAARTAVDLARCCGLRQGVVAADHVLRTGVATRAEMQEPSIVAVAAAIPVAGIVEMSRFKGSRRREIVHQMNDGPVRKTAGQNRNRCGNLALDA